MVSIGYDFGDWLIKKRVLKYVKFYSPQQKELEAILDDFMLWHKENALAVYGKDVARVSQRFSDGAKKPIGSEEIQNYLNTFRKRYFESFSHLSKKLTPLLAQLNEDQVERSKVLLGRMLDDKKDRSQIKTSELLKELEGKWAENLEEWFGELSVAQKALIKKKSSSTFINPKVVWARQGKRTNDFINSYDSKAQGEREAALSKFFNDWQEEDLYRQWRQDVSDVLAAFLTTIDSTQRKHALKKLNEIASIIKDLQD